MSRPPPAPFDSHPIRDLGVESQTVMASYGMRMNFVCDRGTRVWPKTAPPA